MVSAGAALVALEAARTGSAWSLVPDMVLVELAPPWSPGWPMSLPGWQVEAMAELDRRATSGSLSEVRRLRMAGRIANASGEPRIVVRPSWPRWVQPAPVVDRRATRLPQGSAPWWGDMVRIHPVDGDPSPDIWPQAMHVMSIDGFSGAIADGTLEVDVRRTIGGLGASPVDLAIASGRVSMTLVEEPLRAVDGGLGESLAPRFVVAVDREHAIAWIDPTASELDGGDVIVGGLLELLRDGEVVAGCAEAIGAPHAMPLRWVDAHAVSGGGSPRIGMPETIEWHDAGGAHQVSQARGRWQVRLTGELRPALINELRRAADAPPDRPWTWATRWWSGTTTIDLVDAGLGRPALSPAATTWQPPPAAQASPEERSMAAFVRDRRGEARGLLFP